MGWPRLSFLIESQIGPQPTVTLAVACQPLKRLCAHSRKWRILIRSSQPLAAHYQIDG